MFMNLFEEFRQYETMWDPLTEAVNIKDLPAKPGIYCILFDTFDSEGKPVQRKYIGLSENIRVRITEHLKAARPDGRDYVVYKAMRKHYYEVIVLEIVDSSDIGVLRDLEKFWIQTLHTFVNDETKSSEIKTVEFNGQSYPLTCSGPGYNMTLGGEGAPCYPPDIVDEIVAMYKTNNYQHVKTRKEFKEKYNTHPQYSKLCDDTLRLFIEANDLPWYNEKEKATIVYANIVKEATKLEKNADSKDGYRSRKYSYLVENTSDPKYRMVCESQAQADALVDYIWARFQKDCGEAFNSYFAALGKREKENKNTMLIEWLIDHQLYDKYLDLSQYDLNTIESAKKSLGGEGNTITKYTKYRGGLCTVHYNVPIKIKKSKK